MSKLSGFTFTARGPSIDGVETGEVGAGGVAGASPGEGARPLPRVPLRREEPGPRSVLESTPHTRVSSRQVPPCEAYYAFVWRLKPDRVTELLSFGLAWAVKRRVGREVSCFETPTLRANLVPDY